MKRLHVHVSVDDLATSARFYSTLFAAEPTVTKTDYVKWMLDDPRVNFPISTRSGQSGLDHLEIQVETQDELHEFMTGCNKPTGPCSMKVRPPAVMRSPKKSWITDPQGLSWETSLTSGESTVCGVSVDLGPIRVAAAAACCTTETPQGACCAPKVELAPAAACCGPNATAHA